jgi:predicted nucleic acid-binding protein
MSDVFLDTGYVIALSDRKDSHHQEARELAEQISQERVQVVTTQDVLVEIGNGLAAVGSRAFAVKYIRAVEEADAFEVVESTPELFQRGLALYEERQDKAWGITDCISFVVMRERGLREALTTDSDFEQAGFTALLEGNS